MAVLLTAAGCDSGSSDEQPARPVQPIAVEGSETVSEDTLLPISTAVARTWNADGAVYSVATIGNSVVIGGDFTSIFNHDGEVLARSHIAAFDRVTGEPTDFAPILDNRVRTFALSPDAATLYVGGAFLNVDDTRRSRIAAFEVATGALTSFNPPAPNGLVRTIAVSEDRVYLGGVFTFIGETEQLHVAALEPATGAVDSSFSAFASDTVKALALGPEGLWMGGDFFQVNQSDQRGIALLNPSDGSLLQSGQMDVDVLDIALSGNQLFIAAGGPGGTAAAFDRTTRTQQWSVASDGDFHAVGVNDGQHVYYGGHFEAIGDNTDADRLVRLNKLTGDLDVSWLPGVNGIRSINAVDVLSDGLYIGGDYTLISGQSQEGFAFFAGQTE